jgi:3-hydroxybenzoate 6-monooxygenase
VSIMVKEQEVPIVIIGGGIGGLSTALGIARLGKEVYVLEQAPAFAEIGAGLQLGPNALNILDKLGLLEAVYDYSVFPRRHVVMDAISGKELSTLDLGNAFRDRYGYPYAVMHRSDLLNTLYEACQSSGYVSLLSNHKVESIENVGERAIVTCSNGNAFIAEAVIGADGLWSKTRELLSNDSPICSQYVAYRGTVPLAEISQNINVNQDDKLTWIGPNIHMVQYSIRRKELFNQVAVFKSMRFNASSNEWGTVEELEERYRMCNPAVLSAIKYINRDRSWKMYDREPINNWTLGRISLLGDAAHPMLQYLAQGACQAIEDAYCMAEKIRIFNDQIPHAFSAYQQERIPRTAQVQRGARIWGEIKHTEDPITSLLRNTLLTQRSSEDYSAVDWLYSHR